MSKLEKTKLCPDCNLEKPISDFYRNSRYSNKYRRYCKVCWGKRSMANVRNKASQYRAYNRRWLQTPAGKFRQLKMNESSLTGHRPIMFTSKEFVAWFKNQPLVCHYCKQPLIMTSLDNPFGGAKNNRRENQLTVDRKNNDLPYMLDNIVLCCRRCNMIKGKWFSEKQMLEIASRYF